MNERQHEHDPLEALLQAQPYIEDAGFTQRVLSALPPRKNLFRLRAQVLWGAGIAAAVAGFCGPGRALFVMLHSAEPSWAAVATAALALAVAAGTAVSVAMREAES